MQNIKILLHQYANVPILQVRKVAMMVLAVVHNLNYIHRYGIYTIFYENRSFSTEVIQRAHRHWNSDTMS